MSAMDLVQEAELPLARGCLYEWLAEVMLHGFSPAAEKLVDGVAELADVLRAGNSPEEAAAEHFELLHLQIAPYESVFLGTSGLVGGEIAEAVELTYRRLHYDMAATDHNCDHVGEELRCLAGFCAAEFHATQHASDPMPVRQAQQRMLHAHLLRWIHPLAAAIELTGSAAYVALSELLLDCVHQHCESLHDVAAPIAPTPAATSTGSTAPTRLDDVADWLCRPVQCGFYLTKRAINAIARDLSLPHGFASREVMVKNLIESAARYDGLSLLVERLKQLAESHRDAYQRYLSQCSVPLVGLAGWTEATEQTIGALDELKALSLAD